MGSANLVLSTPDLRSTALVRHLEQQAGFFLNPKFERSESLPITAETKQVEELNSKVLSSFQCKWFQSFNGLDTIRRDEETQSRIRSILERLVGSDWLLHDPLLIHTLPIWRGQLEPQPVIFYYSSPTDCAQSLRDTWRFPLPFGLALWEYWTLTALKATGSDNIILISEHQIQADPEPYLGQLLGELGIPQPQDWASFNQGQLPAQFEMSTEPAHAAQEIFDALEAHELADVQSRTLSTQSQDMLEHYGQMRAGFEIVKAERDQYQRQLLDGEARNQGLAMATSEDDLLDESPEGSLSAEGSIIKTSVQIRGQQTHHFYAEANSPVLEMLRQYLANPHQEEMIYLNYGEDGNSALYFMSSDMVGLETQALPAD